jgi:hypothetical protein
MAISKRNRNKILVRMKRANQHSIDTDNYYQKNKTNLYSISRVTGDRQSEGMGLKGNKKVVYDRKCDKLDLMLSELASLFQSISVKEYVELVEESECTLFWGYPLDEFIEENL